MEEAGCVHGGVGGEEEEAAVCRCTCVVRVYGVCVFDECTMVVM